MITERPKEIIIFGRYEQRATRFLGGCFYPMEQTLYSTSNCPAIEAVTCNCCHQCRDIATSLSFVNV